jgi:hypothetical protein
MEPKRKETAGISSNQDATKNPKNPKGNQRVFAHWRRMTSNLRGVLAMFMLALLLPLSAQAQNGEEPPPSEDAPQAPDGWTCQASYYEADDGCDCGCGIADPDCPDALPESCTYEWCGSDADPDPNDTTACVEAEPPAEGWTCNHNFYGGDDGCDCGCGVPDPDCENNTYDSCRYNYCPEGEAPAQADPSQCEVGEWTPPTDSGSGGGSDSGGTDDTGSGNDTSDDTSGGSGDTDDSAGNTDGQAGDSGGSTDDGASGSDGSVGGNDNSGGNPGDATGGSGNTGGVGDNGTTSPDDAEEPPPANPANAGGGCTTTPVESSAALFFALTLILIRRRKRSIGPSHGLSTLK